MTTVAPSDSSSSFSSAAPSDHGSNNYSHHSLLALAAAANAAAISQGQGALLGGSVTPSKSLTPRYAAIHGPTSGVAQAYLQQQRHQQQRREARPRFVEGGAPAERYLEPLPQHQHLPPHHQVYGSSHHHHSASGGSISPQTQRGGGGGFSSPSFRQLPPCPASPVSVATAASSSSPSTHTIHPPMLSSTYVANNNNNLNHSSNSPQSNSNNNAAVFGASSNSESCISLRALTISAPHAPSTATFLVHNAPYSGALALDSVASRGLLPSPMTVNLNPSSPSLPRPPSLSDRAPNPRQRSVGGLSGSGNAATLSVSPHRPPVAAVLRTAPEVPDHSNTCAGDDDAVDAEEPSLAHVLGNYYAGIQKVDSMVLTRIGSTGGLLPSTMLSPPTHPMGGFQRQPLMHPPHQLRQLDIDDNGGDERSASTSTGHASPYSSFRLDGSQWEVPSPRIASSTFMDMLALRNSPQAQGMGVVGQDGVASPTNFSKTPRTPTFGSPRTLCGFPGSGASPLTAKQQQSYFMSQYHSQLGGAVNAPAFPSPPEAPALLFDGRLRFTFQPRDGACTVDSLEDDDHSPQQSPR